MRRSIIWLATAGTALVGRPAILALATLLLAAPASAQMKVLICTGDAGMWAQERMPTIRDAVEKVSPGLVTFFNEQSYNFVTKLESPGFVDQFDIVIFGDLALGQITPEAQQVLVDYVDQGGSIIYVIWAKSRVPFQGSREVVPMPLERILPHEHPNPEPREGARAYMLDDPFFEGLDFTGSPGDPAKPLLIMHPYGEGRVYALFGLFGHSYKRVKYATHEPDPVSWMTWPGMGDVWARLLKDASNESPREQPARGTAVAVSAQIQVDATRPVDDIRSANFSMVALQQLYNEDGGAGEDLFLELNPEGFFDRRTQEVLNNTKGAFPDKPAMLRQFGIKGIYMADNSYGSYGGWDDETYATQIAKAVEAATKYPDIIKFFQPGNEPPLNEGYFEFHNRISSGVVEKAPDVKVIGPNKAFNLLGVDEEAMLAYLEHCGAMTDVLNWHIYAQPPSIVRREVLHWTEVAEGKLRSPGPVRVMFTEADAWNTGDSQFNYLMDRAFTFLPMPEIIATFQYCVRPRYEGGTYWFGVLQPEGEFSANYNGYWIWRNLRGKMVNVQAAVTPEAANPNVHVLASRDDDGETITVIAYYDTGYYDRGAGAMSDHAQIALTVQLPEGRYKAERSRAAWNVRQAEAVEGNFEGVATINDQLSPCQAVAYTWTRQ